MIDPEGMEAELRAGRVEFVQAKHDGHGRLGHPVFSASTITALRAILEVTERTEARDPGIEQLHLAGQAAQLAKPPEDMDAEAVVTLPEIPEADDVEHRRESPHQSLEGHLLPGLHEVHRAEEAGVVRPDDVTQLRRGSPGP